jgi:hypothetical protein
LILLVFVFAIVVLAIIIVIFTPRHLELFLVLALLLGGHLLAGSSALA